MPSPADITRVADRRRDREQDISLLTYLGPEGRSGLVWAVARGSSTPVLASSLLGSKTYTPGDTVLGASVSAGGTGGPYTVLAPPPPDQVGAGGTASKSVPAKAAPPTGKLYALFGDVDGGVVRAWDYGAGGQFLAERGFVGIDPSSLASVSCILQDAGGKVAPGSFAYDAGGPGCWDPTADANFNRTVGSGLVWTPPVYSAGFLWWFEFPATSGVDGNQTFTLWKARCDFTGATIVGTVDYPHTSGPVPHSWSSGSFALTDTTAYLVAVWVDLGHEVVGAAAASLPLAGGSGTSADDSSDTQLGLVGLPMASGYSLLAVNPIATYPTLTSRAPGLTSPWSAAWPSDSGWALSPWYNASLSRDRTRASLYGLDGSARAVLEIAPVGGGSAPTSRTLIQSAGVGPAPPSFMFLGN